MFAIAVRDNDWNWYVSPALFNSFYFASELLILHGISNAIEETNLIEAHKKIMAEVQDVSMYMDKFLLALCEALLAKHFGPEVTSELVRKIEDAPGVFDVWLPFYVEIPSDSPLPNAMSL